MKVEVEKKILAEAFGIANRAVNLRGPLPILHHFHLRSEKDRLVVTGNNLDQSYEVDIPCSTIEPGATTIKAKTGMDIISKLPSAPLRLENDEANQRILVEYGRNGRFEIGNLPANEFPKSNAYEYESAMPARILGSLIKSVVFAVADSSDARAVMTGIFMHSNGGQVEMATTDGRRLCYVATQAVMPDFKIIVPGKEMGSLAKLVAKMHPEDTVPCCITEISASFRCNGVTFNTRLMEGVFPDLHRVRPNPSWIQRSARIGKDQLAGALGRLLVVAQEKQSPNLLVFVFEQGRVLITANTPDVGNASEEIPIVFEGPPIKIAFNGRYMLDFVQTISTEELTIGLQDDTRSAVVSPFPALEDITLEYVIMPVRLREVVEAG